MPNFILPSDLSEDFIFDLVNKKIKLSPVGGTDKLQAFLTSYVRSRGSGLITNGYGGMRSNYNFSQFTYITNDYYAGFGCFRNAILNSVTKMDESIAIDPASTYRFSYAIKSQVKNGASKAYGMALPYDSDDLEIMNHHVCGAYFRLGEDYVPGSGVFKIHPDDLARFKAYYWPIRTSGADFYYGSALYTNSTGYTYPVGSYIRNFYNARGRAINLHVFNEANRTIGNLDIIDSRLPAGGLKKGDLVGFGHTGGTYLYAVSDLINLEVGTEWKYYTKDFKMGAIMRPGTAFVRLGWLLNRESQIGNATLVSAVNFRELQ